MPQNTPAKDSVANKLATKHLYSLHSFRLTSQSFIFFLSHQFQETCNADEKKKSLKQGEKRLYHIICCDHDFYVDFPSVFHSSNCSLPSPLKKNILKRAGTRTTHSSRLPKVAEKQATVQSCWQKERHHSCARKCSFC